MTILEFDKNKQLLTAWPILTYNDILNLQLEFNLPSCACYQEINNITFNLYKKGEAQYGNTPLLTTSAFIFIDQTTWTGSIVIAGEELKTYLDSVANSTAVLDGQFEFIECNKIVRSQIFYVKMYRTSVQPEEGDYITKNDAITLIEFHNNDLYAHDNKFIFYAKLTDLDDAISVHNTDLNAHTDLLSTYAKLTDLNSFVDKSILNNYPTTTSVNELITLHNNDVLSHIDLFNQCVKLSHMSDYVKQSQLADYAKITDLNGYATYEQVKDAATVVNNNIIEHNNNIHAHETLLQEYAKKSEIPSLVEGVTEEELKEAIDDHNISVTAHADKFAAVNLALTTKANLSDLNNYTPTATLELEYAKKTDVPDTSSFALKTELNAKQNNLTAGNNIDITNDVISSVIPYATNTLVGGIRQEVISGVLHIYFE